MRRRRLQRLEGHETRCISRITTSRKPCNGGYGLCCNESMDPNDSRLLLRMQNSRSKVVTLQQTCRELEARIAELATTRDEAVDSDRRVRRGLYRLSAGRMDIEEVLKAVEDDDKDGMAAAMAMEVANEVPSSTA